MTLPFPYEFWLVDPGLILGTAGTGTSGLPKLEGVIRVPSVGWSFDIDEPGAGATITIPQARYYLTSTSIPLGLAPFIEAALNAAGLDGVYAVRVDDDYDGSTGRLVIAATGVAGFSLGWVSEAVRDALGFTGDLTGAAQYISPKSSPHIWLPDGRRYPAMTPDGHPGLPLYGSTVVSSPSGVTHAIRGPKRRGDTLEFGNVRGEKIFEQYASLVTPNSSLEVFVDTNFPRKIRYHKNRADDATFVTYRSFTVDRLPVTVEADTATWTSDADSLWHVGPLSVGNGDPA